MEKAEHEKPNEEQLEILKQGVDVWNKWREENPEVEVWLYNADLSEMNLNEVNFRDAYLREANLSGAKFFTATLSGAFLLEAKLLGADLRAAFLTGVKLIRADLRGANLSASLLGLADIRGANLEYAKLKGADLTEVNFRQANLGGANLSEAILYETIFADTNLANTQGLDVCKHKGKSTIDQRTLEKSPNLPIEFLKGVGLSDEIIQSYLYGNTISLLFKRRIWGQLIPIEHALRTTLGEQYIVEKSSDRIVVKLNKIDQIQIALDAVIPVLTGLESVSKGEVEEITIEPKEGGVEHLDSENIQQMLAYLIKRFDQIWPPDKKPLNLKEKSLVEGVRRIPVFGDLIALWVKTSFEKDISQQLHHTFKRFFQAAKEVAELPKKDEPKKLPSGENEDV